MTAPSNKNDPNILLYSRRLLLRRVEEHDQQLLELLFCNAEIMHYLGGVWSREQVARTLQEWHTEWGNNHYWYGVVVKRDTLEAIGIAGLTENTNPEEAGVEFSWFIRPEHQKQGYATEITQSLLRVAFEYTDADRVFAETHPENVASNRVLEKTGFINLGIRNHQYDYLPGFEQQVVWEYQRSSWEIKPF